MYGHVYLYMYGHMYEWLERSHSDHKSHHGIFFKKETDIGPEGVDPLQCMKTIPRVE